MTAPYFEAGLESGTFSIWIPADPLTEELGRVALGRVVPDFDRYLARGSFEIVSAGVARR